MGFQVYLSESSDRPLGMSPGTLWTCPVYNPIITCYLIEFGFGRDRVTRPFDSPLQHLLHQLHPRLLSSSSFPLSSFMQSLSLFVSSHLISPGDGTASSPTPKRRRPWWLIFLLISGKLSSPARIIAFSAILE